MIIELRNIHAKWKLLIENTCMLLANVLQPVSTTSLPRLGVVRGLMSAKVRAKVQVERGLASANRLRPPLHVAPRFRDKDKRRGL
jgi:hypothetical protein